MCLVVRRSLWMALFFSMYHRAPQKQHDLYLHRIAYIDPYWTNHGGVLQQRLRQTSVQATRRGSYTTHFMRVTHGLRLYSAYIGLYQHVRFWSQAKLLLFLQHLRAFVSRATTFSLWRWWSFRVCLMPYFAYV